MHIELFDLLLYFPTGHSIHLLVSVIFDAVSLLGSCPAPHEARAGNLTAAPGKPRSSAHLLKPSSSPASACFAQYRAILTLYVMSVELFPARRRRLPLSEVVLYERISTEVGSAPVLSARPCWKMGMRVTNVSTLHAIVYVPTKSTMSPVQLKELLFLPMEALQEAVKPGLLRL